jgi:hypothetical protein
MLWSFPYARKLTCSAQSLYLIGPRKSKDVIEPILKPQWWVNSKPLAEEALAVSDTTSICGTPLIAP